MMEPADKYHISFDTKSNPGKVEAVTVSLSLDTLVDDDRKVRIDLAEHPLYKDLQQYVLANPR
jgi:hypothetical protein